MAPLVPSTHGIKQHSTNIPFLRWNRSVLLGLFDIPFRYFWNRWAILETNNLELIQLIIFTSDIYIINIQKSNYLAGRNVFIIFFLIIKSLIIELFYYLY